MIIDVHCHLGWDHSFEEDFRREDLVDKMQRYNVDVQIVQPGTTHNLEDACAYHDAIADLCRAYPGRFFGMANPSPHLRPDDYRGEVRRCIQDLGFVAIKLHPLAHGVKPNSRAGRLAFEAAREHKVPLMVHTGAGIPFAAPINLLPMAQEYADVKIVMAHCASPLSAEESAAVLEQCPNVYGDMSWASSFLLLRWRRRFGPRFMLGSDHAENTGSELAKITTVGLTPEEQADFLENAARAVFPLRLT